MPPKELTEEQKLALLKKAEEHVLVNRIYDRVGAQPGDLGYRIVGITLPNADPETEPLAVYAKLNENGRHADELERIPVSQFAEKFTLRPMPMENPLHE